ncbi:MAG: hypothetical protein ACYDH9_01920 [Limisphaerales bacterium]
MGIRDRDYMKRPSGDEAQRGSSPDARLEALLNGFLQRHPRFFIYLVVAVVGLIIVALVVAKFADKGQ